MSARYITLHFEVLNLRSHVSAQLSQFIQVVMEHFHIGVTLYRAMNLGIIFELFYVTVNKTMVTG